MTVIMYHQYRLFILLFAVILSSSCLPKQPEERVINSASNEAEKHWEENILPFNDVLSIKSDVNQMKSSFDFNGDGKKDYVYVVTVSTLSPPVDDNIKIIFPWVMNKAKVGAARIFSTTSLFIVHGGTEPATLIRDINPMSLLDTQAAKSIQVVRADPVISVDEGALVNLAKGDVIVIPTEAGIDTYLYWNGVGYKEYMPLEVP